MLRRANAPTFLAVALLTSLATAPRPALARDLVKQAVTLALADEPPPPLSVQIERKRRLEEEKAAEVQRKEEDEKPAYKKWWFWALAGGLVVGTTSLIVASRSKDTTEPARSCDDAALACFGAGRR